jgi:nucleotide-binding universal stress UspA family protein
MTTPPTTPSAGGILVGYTTGDLGQAALAAAIEEARVHGDDLILLNLTRGDAYSDPHFATHEQLEQLTEQLSATGLTYQIDQRVSADPAGELVSTALTHDTRLIVIGLRHRSSVGKFLMGSNAQAILMDAPCPVLTVKA